MRSHNTFTGLATLVAATTSVISANAQLLSASTISDLLSGLGPAPDSDPRWTDWQPAGPGDVRSPCPGLNALANHGFINRNGKDLNIPDLIQGLAAGLNIGADFTVAIGAVGLFSSPYPLEGSFNLNDLDQHNFPIEHDGSLSRADAYYGNDYSFNQTYFDEVMSYFAGSEVTTTPQASKARYHRISTSLAENPTAVYGAREFILSSGETGLYVQTMSSPLTNSANLTYVRTLFEEERLPFAEGWRPSATPITLLSLGEYLVELLAANPDAVGETLTITEDSYANLFEVLVGGSEVLANLTQGISSALGL